MLRQPDERGFTLVELLIVVLVIGILLVIGLPAFLGARARAQDRKVQTDIRQAFTTERTYYTDGQTYSDVVSSMTAIESELPYANGDTPLATGPVYLHYHPAQNQIFLSSRSASGTCFYLTEINGGGITFASSSTCGIADSQVYNRSW